MKKTSLKLKKSLLTFTLMTKIRETGATFHPFAASFVL